MSDEFRSGFDELSEILKGYELTDEKVLKALEAGAAQFTGDVQKLPKPRSRIRKSGHEHLLDTVTYQRTKISCPSSPWGWNWKVCIPKT